jgi:hypothetical protein
MNEQRRHVLEMLSQGQITADEAERLIAALEKEPGTNGSTNGGANVSTTKPASPKYLRVLVDAVDKSPANNPVKVNVRVPMQLLRAGVRLVSLIPVQAREHVNEALHEQGMNVDLGQIKADDLEALVDHLNELTVDVDVDDPHDKSKVKVRVFCE